MKNKNKYDFKDVTLYDWTLFYRELAEKIAALQGPEDLLSKAGECFEKKNKFSDYKESGADPFSFLSFLTTRKAACSKVKEVFELSADIPSDNTYPPANSQKALFHDGTEYETELLWAVFRKVLKNKKIEKEDFEQVLKVKNVAMVKFSSVLFLIDPNNFYPLHEKLLYLRILDKSDAEKIRKNKVSYEDYQKIGKVIKKSFEGCSFCESNLLAYLMANGDLNISTKYFQINSKVFGDRYNHIDDFYTKNAVRTGGQKDTKTKYPLSEPERGDIILSHFTKTGNGIGIVLENLYTEDYRPEDSIKVIWINKTEREKAVNSIQMLGMSKVDAIRGSFKAVYGEVFSMMEKWQNQEAKESTASDISDTAGDTAPQHELNTILYGPPGTGKTYQTIMRAAEIIKKKKFTPEEYDEARKIFNEAKESGRVVFCTFHQSYGYEDFIQGIKPDVDNEEDARLKFTRVDGMLKKIATHALYEYYKIDRKNRKNNAEQAYNDDIFFLFWEDLKTRLKKLKNDEELRLNTKRGGEIVIVSINNNNNINVSHKGSQKLYLVSLKRFISLVEKISPAGIHNIYEDIIEAIGGCNTSAYWAVYKEFEDFKKKYERDHEGQEDSFAEDDVDYPTKKDRVSTFDWEKIKDIDKAEVPAFVLIIDEINRANISNVLGELITLIESDKRLGAAHALDVTLPSGEPFGIPDNVYIVGTMNTADKSIALVDIALRRRFYFEPMYPDYDIEGLVGVEVLKKMNENIIKEKGHDYQIGHAYFIKNNDEWSDKQHIVDTLNHKVLPLLLEYFRNDEAQVKEVMRDTGYQVVEGEFPLRVKKAPSQQ